MTSLRPVRRLSLPAFKRRAANTCAQARPDLRWLPLSSLVIDDTYQRALSNRSVRLISQIVSDWNWYHVKALSVLQSGDRYEIVDGQHTAIAAATHGGIADLPCLVLPRTTTAEAASAFVGINTHRVALTAANLFRASLASGDDLTLAVVDAARAARATLLTIPPSDGRFAPGSVIAVGALKQIATKKGRAGLARVLQIGVDARLAPITAPAMKAIALLLWSAKYKTGCDDGDIATVLRAESWPELEAQARLRAAGNGVRRIDALASMLKEKVGAL